MNGLGPAEPCALLQQTNNKLHAIIQLLLGESRSYACEESGRSCLLLIAADLSRLKSRVSRGKNNPGDTRPKTSAELSSLLNQKGARVR